MRTRTPRILTRFLLAELLRLAAMTAAALVTLIAFAAAVKPLADGQIGPAEAVRFMALAVVPMLQFALPFAAGFAATMAYHRFASDNEATAAAAAGIPHRVLLLPAALCGLLFAALLSVLAEQAIPHFLRSMEKIITRNVAGLMTGAIEQGRSIAIGDFDVHAREVVRLDADPATGAAERLRLTGVFAAQTDDDGSVVAHVSAEQVFVWLFDDATGDEPATAVQMRFVGASGRGRGDAMIQQEFLTRRIRVPGAFTDDPKFLTWSQLRDCRTHPERHINKVETLRRRLAARVAEFRAMEAIDAALASSGRALFARGDERLAISDARLADTDEGAMLRPSAGRLVRLEWRRADGRARIQECASARLVAEDIDPSGGGSSLAANQDSRAAPGESAAWGPAFRLEAERVVTIEQGGREPDAERARLVFGGLRLLAAPAVSTGTGPAGAGVVADPSTLGVFELLEEARRLGSSTQPGGTGVPPVTTQPPSSRSPSPAAADSPSADRAERLAAAARDLARLNSDLQREVTSKQHERAAFSAACFLMVVLGGIVALRRRDALPLPVYLWSFFPALTAVITISSGQRLTHQAGAPGLLLLWGGVAALAAVAVAEFVRLRKH